MGSPTVHVVLYKPLGRLTWSCRGFWSQNSAKRFARKKRSELGCTVEFKSINPRGRSPL